MGISDMGIAPLLNSSEVLICGGYINSKTQKAIRLKFSAVNTSLDSDGS